MDSYGVIRKDGVNYSHDTAESISYDNTTSGLTATDAQEAIDEVAGMVTSGVVSGVKGDAETDYRKGNVNITPTNIGLGNVGNFKAVSTVADQGLSNDEKSNARTNIGAGTSSFSGSYNDLSNKPGVTTTSAAGLCPKLNGSTANYLRGDGTWVTPPDNNTTYSAGSNITLSGTTFSLTKANVTGALGYTPPTTNTTYNVATTSAAGLCPKLGGGTSNYLRADGSWATPPDHTYTVNNGTLTIQKNGSNVATFSANQSGNATANITVPTKTSQLTNDSSFITSDTRVYQENSSANAAHRVLYSYTADDTNRNEGTRKGQLFWNAYAGNLYLGYNGASWSNLGSIRHNQAQSLYLAASQEEDFKVFLGVANVGGSLQWTFCPYSDGTIRLGNANQRWDPIFSTSGTINTSDRNLKKDIDNLDANFVKKFIMDLKPVSYKLKSGSSNRTHYGMIAQDVEETMDKLGMTALDFAGFCKDAKVRFFREDKLDEDGNPVLDEAGNVIQEEKSETVEGEYIYGLRYEEFISPMIKVIQDQQKEIDTLKEEVKLLKELINKG